MKLPMSSNSNGFSSRTRGEEGEVGSKLIKCIICNNKIKVILMKLSYGEIQIFLSLLSLLSDQIESP